MDQLLGGLLSVLTYSNLAYCFAGAALGTLVGVLPGLGPSSTLAILLPITAHLDPTGRDHHAGRDLLWRHVRRLHDVDPGEYSGRGRLRRHLLRRLPDDASGSRRPGAVDRRRRLVHRRDDRRDRHLLHRSRPRQVRVEIRSARVLRAVDLQLVDADRPCRRIGDQGARRRADRDGAGRRRSRSPDGNAADELRADRISREGSRSFRSSSDSSASAKCSPAPSKARSISTKAISGG